MVVVEQSKQVGQEIWLKSNQSLSWRGNLQVFGGLAVLSLLIAVGFALVGAWVVLPFAGLELACLAIGLYYTAWQATRQQRIWLTIDQICIEKGHRRLEQRYVLQREWTTVQVFKRTHGVGADEVSLCYRNQIVPVGEFLNQADRALLVEHLKQNGLSIEIHLT
ncbi:DUF2244 domain-containing protein [Spartinivicinus poritis]|uniref:DUF2244 domain-containing protein n=1 Tax=Spartinivicinus poritis TaxID=2994640 RepID=A0ABT5UFM9_9GAMM|nr:DUF2244 domain-containing protein [Spartinivicinus sp. A2-2]MDE1465184.1 DUF2244 domain-containing protein [Spartinivicinus sp. A2-2]